MFLELFKGLALTSGSKFNLKPLLEIFLAGEMRVKLKVVQLLKILQLAPGSLQLESQNLLRTLDPSIVQGSYEPSGTVLNN
jgi:hypothetical protein